MSANQNSAIVWQCLERAVAAFNQSKDRKELLEPRSANPTSAVDLAAASERAITHRLAVYLECELRKVKLEGGLELITVDCEYNRHLQGGKSLVSEQEERIWEIVKKVRKKELKPNDDGYYVFSVLPDMVVHQRQKDENNLLAVEIKKRSNREAEEYDGLKLELFTKPKIDNLGYGYFYGAWIIAEDDLPREERILKIVSRYKNGVKIQ